MDQLGQRLYQFASAIYSAPSCSEIWVAQGTYSPTVDAVNRRSFRLIPGSASMADSRHGNPASQRDWTTIPSWLTGGIGGAALFDNIARTTPVDSSAVLDGFVIQAAGGYGIYNLQASPTIRNARFLPCAERHL